MQKQIHSTYLYKLFYLKWQLGLLDIENKEIIWYEFVKPNWNLFENFPKLIRIAEKKKKSNNYHTWDIVQQKKVIRFGLARPTVGKQAQILFHNSLSADG